MPLTKEVCENQELGVPSQKSLVSYFVQLRQHSGHIHWASERCRRETKLPCAGAQLVP